MAKKQINTEHIEGRIYEFDLEVKQVKNKDSKNFGMDFIAGTLDVAVDEDGLNVVQVHYTYVSPTTAKGNANRTFNTLKKIIDTGKCWVADGKDEATMVSIDTSLALNDFYTDDGLVTVMRNEGGFIDIVTKITEDGIDRHKFTTDMVITNITTVEANEERQMPEYTSVRGAIFNFRNNLLPVEYRVLNPDGRKYFESLDVTGANPIYTKVWGTIDNITTMIEKKEESAWGGTVVTQVPRKQKAWVITGASGKAYPFPDEKTLTMEEITKAQQERETMLAEEKQRREAYKAQQASGAAAHQASVPNAGVATGGFTF